MAHHTTKTTKTIVKRAIMYSALVLACSTTSIPLALFCTGCGFYFILKGET